MGKKKVQHISSQRGGVSSRTHGGRKRKEGRKVFLSVQRCRRKKKKRLVFKVEKERVGFVRQGGASERFRPFKKRREGSSTSRERRREKRGSLIIHRTRRSWGQRKKKVLFAVL